MAIRKPLTPVGDMSSTTPAVRRTLVMRISPVGDASLYLRTAGRPRGSQPKLYGFTDEQAQTLAATGKPGTSTVTEGVCLHLRRAGAHRPRVTARLRAGVEQLTLV